MSVLIFPPDIEKFLFFNIYKEGYICWEVHLGFERLSIS